MRTTKSLSAFPISEHMQPALVNETDYIFELLNISNIIFEMDCSLLISDFHTFMYTRIIDFPEVIARLLLFVPVINEIEKNSDELKACFKTKKLSSTGKLNNYIKSLSTIIDNIDILFDDLCFLQGNNLSEDLNCHTRIMNVVNLLWWIERNKNLIKKRFDEIKNSEISEPIPIN